MFTFQKKNINPSTDVLHHKNPQQYRSFKYVLNFGTSVGFYFFLDSSKGNNIEYYKMATFKILYHHMGKKNGEIYVYSNNINEQYPL